MWKKYFKTKRPKHKVIAWAKAVKKMLKLDREFKQAVDMDDYQERNLKNENITGEGN
jgi:hypothetical protein